MIICFRIVERFVHWTLCTRQRRQHSIRKCKFSHLCIRNRFVNRILAEIGCQLHIAQSSTRNYICYYAIRASTCENVRSDGLRTLRTCNSVYFNLIQIVLDAPCSDVHTLFDGDTFIGGEPNATVNYMIWMQTTVRKYCMNIMYMHSNFQESFRKCSSTPRTCIEFPNQTESSSLHVRMSFEIILRLVHFAYTYIIVCPYVRGPLCYIRTARPVTIRWF